MTTTIGHGLLGAGLGAIEGGIAGGLPGAIFKGAIGGVLGLINGYQIKQGQDALSDAMDSLSRPPSPVTGSALEPTFGGYTVSRRGAALSHQVIYGETKVGGVIVFDDAGGADNKYLSRIIAFAGHEIDSFQQIYMGKYSLSISGDNVTSAQEIDENGQAVGSATTKFNNYIKVRRVLGNHTSSLNGTAPANFSSKWTSNHKLLGIAHLAIVFEYADDIWEEGLPEISAKIRGKKVLDTRTSTTAWSDNPALIVRDFLTNDDYGLGEPSSSIDDTLINTAANVCEETVTDGDRYTANGAWVTSQAPIDLLNQLMTSCAGMLWYAQGKWRLKAGDYVAPSITLTDDDLRAPLSVVTRHSRRDNFNGVRGTFRGPKSNYQFTDYPKVTDSSFVTVDGGEEVLMDLTLPFTDTPEQAQRLATIALEKNREQISISGTFGLKAFELQVGDNVKITNSRFGWTNKIFEVIGWSFAVENFDLLVNLTLRETNANVYDEFLNITGFESNNTNLPGSLGAVAGGGDVNSTTDVTGLTASGGIREIYVNWTNPINNDFSFTRLYYDDDTSISGASTVDVTGESHVLTGLQPNETWSFWAQAYDTSNNTLGSLTSRKEATTKRADTDDIVGQAITSSLIANGAVDTTHIANLAVNNAKIDNLTIESGKLFSDGRVAAGNFYKATSNNSTGTLAPQFGSSGDSYAFVLVIAHASIFGGFSSADYQYNNSAAADLELDLIIDGSTTSTFSASNLGIAAFPTHTLVGGKSNVSGTFTAGIQWDMGDIENDSVEVSVTVWRFFA